MYVLIMHLASHQAWLLSEFLTVSVINNDIPRPNKPWAVEGRPAGMWQLNNETTVEFYPAQ